MSGHSKWSKIKRKKGSADAARGRLFSKLIKAITIAARHGGGGMDNPSPEAYLNFLRSPWCDTAFVEFRAAGRLMAVAVTDVLPQGLSAVYTFYEPEATSRSLGTCTILWQIEEARRRALPWLYLGYWIEDCDKMRYKGRFRPLQAFRDSAWHDLE